MKRFNMMKIAVFTALFFVLFCAVSSAQTVKIADVTILPPVTGVKSQLTTGQMMVAAKEIYQTPVNGSMVEALKAAKTRAEQEEVLLKFMSEGLRKKFEEMNTSSAEQFTPEEITPQTDESEALNLAVNKQPFGTFSEWGSSPFGKPAKDWKALRDHFQEYMESVIERTTYSEEVKADWIDRLQNCLANGPDGRFCKEVNVQDWPLWQWTTGRTAGVAKEGRLPGVNIKYTGRPAKAIWIALPRYGMAVMHGYECRGNPIVPYVGSTTFRLTKELAIPETKPPAKCECKIIRADGLSGALAEIYPDESVSLRVEVNGSEKLQIQEEYWRVDGQVRARTQREFTFKASDYAFKLNLYQVDFALTDQFGRTSVCVFVVRVKARPPSQLITQTVPRQTPKVEEPKTPHISRCKTGCKILILAAVAGGGIGACAAAGCFGGKQSTPTAIVPTKPGIGAPGITAAGPGWQISFSLGGGRPRS